MNSLNIAHNWKIKSFTAITFCDHCAGLLWGICAQGFQCADCNFCSHSHCTSLVTLHCNNNNNSKKDKNNNNNSSNINNTTNTNTNTNTQTVIENKEEESNSSFNSESSLLSGLASTSNNSNSNNNNLKIYNRQHNFHKTSKSISKFCNYCRETTFTISGEPMMCSDCRYIAHGQCIDKAPANCIIPFNQNHHNHHHNHDVNDNNIKHHWVEGNLKDSKKCMQCFETCEKSFSLAHYKCLWCSKHIHSSCFDKHNPICDFGSLSDMILPPSSIRLVNGSNNGNGNTVENDNNLVEWEIIPELNILPDKLLFVFVNSKSGGQFGSVLIRKLSSLLNPFQIVDLIKQGGPDSTLMRIKHYIQVHPNEIGKFRILVCGGDGTVGWIFKQMSKLQIPSTIPIGIIPLGTGNDLARSLGWGIGYDGEKLLHILKNINEAKTVTIDTWKVTMNDIDNPDDIRILEMNNYFSIGLDASVALGFHLARNANPHLFTGRAVNKFWYTKIGLEEFVLKSFVKLTKILKLSINGQPIKLDKSIEGIIILNLGSYAGGVDLWGANKECDNVNGSDNNQYIDDSKLEVIGVTSLPHLGSCLSNLLSPIKIGQADEISIEISIPDAPELTSCIGTTSKGVQIETAFQIDGEPEPIDVKNSTIKIQFFKKVSMLSSRSFKTRTTKQQPDNHDNSSFYITSQSPNTYSPPPNQNPNINQQDNNNNNNNNNGNNGNNNINSPQQLPPPIVISDDKLTTTTTTTTTNNTTETINNTEYIDDSEQVD